MSESTLFDMRSVRTPDGLLVAPPPTDTRARTTDPVTSHDAARHVDRFRAEHYRRILRAVAEHPGSTAHELAPYAGLDNVQINRRLSELEAAGLVKRTHRRPCRRTGRLALTVFLTQSQTERTHP